MGIYRYIGPKWSHIWVDMVIYGYIWVYMGIYGYIMLYGPEGGGRGRKSKYMVLLRCGRVQFDFSNCPAGWPGRRIYRPRPACQLDSAARQDSLKNQTVLGHPAGQFDKSNCTRPHRRRTIYLAFRPRPPPSGPYSIIYLLFLFQLKHTEIF